jgi:hypothetical protein
MAEPLSNGAACHRSVPEAYVFPAHQRPVSSPSPGGAAAIPVVDLGADDPDRIVRQIIDAGREFGLFQVKKNTCVSEFSPLAYRVRTLPVTLSNCLIDL